MSELEALPEGWYRAKLDDVADWGSGGTPKRSNPGYYGGKIPWVTIADLNNDIVLATKNYLTEKGVEESAARLVPEKTVLLALYGSIGKLGIAGTDLTTNQAIATAAPNDNWIDHKYLFHYLASQIQSLNMLGSGVTQKNIYLKDVKAYPIQVAPRREQTRIVEKLEELLSDLDNGVAELKAAQIKLTQYRQSLLKSAVEGSLTAEWRKKNQPSETGQQLLQRILTERRQRWEQQKRDEFKQKNQKPPKDWQLNYPEPVQPDTSALPELPEGWVWASAAQLGLVQLGRQRTPSKMYGTNPTLYIRAANITEAGIDFSDVLKMDFTEREIPIYRLHPGDVLLTEASGSPEHVGRPCIWPETNELYCFQNTVIRFTPVGVKPEFCFELFHAYQKLGKYIDVAAGVGINHLSAGKFSRIPFPLPSANEQDALVRIIHSEKSLILRKLETIEATLKQSEAQRKNILKEAFSGKLVSQDPSDEPASILLEKIKAERTAQAKQPNPKQTKKKANNKTSVMDTLFEVLKANGGWMDAQEAFRACGVTDSAETDRIEELYVELRKLDKAKKLLCERHGDYDMIKLKDE
ncbi:MAG TPA: restriction endonuclease subunit S [Cellvibrionaceae bacterium]